MNFNKGIQTGLILLGILFAQWTFAQTKAHLKAALKDPTHQLWSEKAPDKYQAKFWTTKGTFTIEVNRDWAPIGADRFYHLVQTGFFDKSRLYRIRADFIAQFGIAGKAEIAQVWRYQKLKDDPVKASNLKGYVAYAMTGVDERTTQVYINLVDNVRLDSTGFAPFGKVVEGMDVVESFYSFYGESSGGGMRTNKQDQMFEQGNQWLDRYYPNLDRIKKARIVKNGVV